MSWVRWLVCAAGIHFRRQVRDCGKNRYWQCRCCGRRGYTEAFSGGHQPVDANWLAGGEWYDARRVRPPAGACSGVVRGR